MIRSFVLTVAVAWATVSHAQTALDRVSVALGQCVGSVEQRVDQIADLQKQLAAAQARIKELEPKTEPKKD